MKKLDYVDEFTFEKTEQQFEDFHYDLAKNIISDIHDRYEVGWKKAKVTGLLSNKEGDKLIICVIENRNNGELVANKYRISIEKVV